MYSMDMVRVGEMGKLHPARMVCSSLALCPIAAIRTEPGGATRVCIAGVTMQKPRSQVRPALHPVAAIKPLGARLEGVRCTCSPK